MFRCLLRAMISLCLLWLAAGMALAREFEASPLPPDAVIAYGDYASFLVALDPDVPPNLLMIDGEMVRSLTCTPDGSELAFVVGRSLYLIRSGDPNIHPTPVRLNGFYNDYNLSKDSAFILRRGLAESLVAPIERIRLADGASEAILNFVPTLKPAVALAPDGQRFVFESSRRDYGINLYLSDISGADVRLLVRNGYHPAWSPDGTMISFVRYPTPFSRHIYLHDIERGRTVPLTRGRNVANGYPAWTPDSAHVIFLSTRGTLTTMELMRLGGAQRRVTSGVPNSYTLPCLLSFRPTQFDEMIYR